MFSCSICNKLCSEVQFAHMSKDYRSDDICLSITQDFEEACGLLSRCRAVRLSQQEVMASDTGPEVLSFLCALLQPFIDSYQVPSMTIRAHEMCQNICWAVGCVIPVWVIVIKLRNVLSVLEFEDTKSIKENKEITSTIIRTVSMWALEVALVSGNKTPNENPALIPQLKFDSNNLIELSHYHILYINV